MASSGIPERPRRQKDTSPIATKGEAQSFEKFVKDQAQDKPWPGDKTDKRQVIELVELWFCMASPWRMARSGEPQWRSPARQWVTRLQPSLTR